MPIEELKLILETVDAAGENAAKLVLLWMCLGFIENLVRISLIGGVIWVLWKIIGVAISYGSFTGEVGRIMRHYPGTEGERSVMLQKIRKWQKPDDGSA